MHEAFTARERELLAPYFTNLDGPVFALTNLPEVVKGALFARYSRSPKSLRRLFLDEFLATGTPWAPAPAALDTSRAEGLYDRVLSEYGDDSVAQLGGVHLACEGASNILTKVLEWGRLMAYLEQSTRYIPYDDKPMGRYRYHVPSELSCELRDRFISTVDESFATYSDLLLQMQEHFKRRYPREATTAEGPYRTSIRAKALDTCRGLLPAAVTSNVGMYGTGQAYEQLLLRMRGHSLMEVRAYADQALIELRKVIPAFLKRVDIPDRGGAWSAYLKETRVATEHVASRILRNPLPGARAEVTLTDFDPEGEVKVVAAVLYTQSNLPDDQLLRIARKMSVDERVQVLQAYVGVRSNRRHKPGRAFERTAYRFDVLTDYGAFRDLQRHRLLSLEWQRLSPDHGFSIPEPIIEVGREEEWRRTMDAASRLYYDIEAQGLRDVAPYVIPMAFRVRFYMHMNAREAMHVIELRTTSQGHAAYRRVCQAMHDLIKDEAGHAAIAASMKFVDHSPVELERLEAESSAAERSSRYGDQGIR